MTQGADFDWTDWKLFPDPRKGGYLHAPVGPGVYELRNKKTNELILFGRGKNAAKRMTSLLPEPWGSGTRRNHAKREYVGNYLAQIEYRTCACPSDAAARQLERTLRARAEEYLFGT